MSRFASALAVAEPVPLPDPLPLRRALPPAEPFPLAFLGPLMEPAARAIMDRVQCSDAIAAQSILGAASLATQAHADVIIPATGHARPLSLFLVAVAGSGERKSAADGEALAPIRQHEQALRDRHAWDKPRHENAKAAWDEARKKALAKSKGDYAAGRDALDAIGPAPVPPPAPMLLVREPTLGGLHKLFGEGEPSLGLFSDEAGGFLGGHGMSEENRLHMAAGLSELWDGAPISRVRVGDGATVMPGRRLAAHLMVQPGVADRLLSNVARCICAAGEHRERAATGEQRCGHLAREQRSKFAERTIGDGAWQTAGPRNGGRDNQRRSGVGNRGSDRRGRRRRTARRTPVAMPTRAASGRRSGLSWRTFAS